MSYVRVNAEHDVNGFVGYELYAISTEKMHVTSEESRTAQLSFDTFFFELMHALRGLRYYTTIPGLSYDLPKINAYLI